MIDVLCSNCQRLCSGIKEIVTVRDEEQDLGLWMATSENCHLCYLLEQALARQGHGSLRHSGLPLHLSFRPSYVGFGLGLLSPESVPRPLLAAVVDFDRGGPEAKISTFTSNNLGSDETWSCVVEWMRTCQTDHRNQHCSRSSVQRDYPKRLVSISGTDQIKICDTSRWTQRELYATLSHCWGGRPLISLTRDNLDQYLKSIPYNQLPKTFCDTIEVVKRLGLRYVWIDSLCIIQDSLEDWNHESARMLSIYRGSYLTIAAAAASNPDDGLFMDRNPLSVIPCAIKTGLKQQGVTYTTISHGCTSLAAWFSLPLAKRGWVVQELIISPRVLYFAGNEVAWQCCSLFATETFRVGSLEDDHLGLYGYLSLYDDRFYGRVRGCVHLDASTTDHSLWETWNSLIEQYSSKSLTRFSDKLVAIRGLANIFEESWKDQKPQYLAGLWSRWLRQGLLWRVRDSKHESHSMFLIAPSWSWASVNTHVLCYPRTPTLRTHGMAKVLDANTKLLIDDTLQTPVLRGSITLSGLLRTFEPRKDDPADVYYIVHVRAKGQAALPGIPSAIELDIQFDLGDLYRDTTKRVFMIPLQLYQETIRTAFLQGLVLGKIDQSKGSYTRLGTFEVFEYVPDEDFDETIMFQETGSYLTAIDSGIIAHNQSDESWDPNDPFDNGVAIDKGRTISECRALGFKKIAAFLESYASPRDSEFLEDDEYKECEPNGLVTISIL